MASNEQLDQQFDQVVQTNPEIQALIQKRRPGRPNPAIDQQIMTILQTLGLDTESGDWNLGNYQNGQPTGVDHQSWIQKHGVTAASMVPLALLAGAPFLGAGATGEGVGGLGTALQGTAAANAAGGATGAGLGAGVGTAVAGGGAGPAAEAIPATLTSKKLLDKVKSPVDDIGGMDFKKLLTLLGIQSGLGAVSGALTPVEGRNSFAGKPGVDPTEMLGNATQGGYGLASALTKRLSGPPAMRQPNVRVPGVPFEIGAGNAPAPPGLPPELSSLFDSFLKKKVG